MYNETGRLHGGITGTTRPVAPCRTPMDDGMDCRGCDTERELIARRREHCLSMAANLPPDGHREESKRLYKTRQRYN